MSQGESKYGACSEPDRAGQDDRGAMKGDEVAGFVAMEGVGHKRTLSETWSAWWNGENAPAPMGCARDNCGGEGAPPAGPMHARSRSMPPMEGAEGRRGREAEDGAGVARGLAEIWSMLKDYVGGNLAGDGMFLGRLPVFLFEPVTSLQRASEAVDQCQLLVEAASRATSGERLALVGLFFASNYHANKRTKVPLNSCAGETYEAVDEATGMTFLAECIQSSPFPVMAFCAELPGTLTFHATGRPESSFAGNSVVVTHPGSHNRITFDRTGDDIVFDLPTSTVNNVLLPGATYIDHHGEVHLRNQTTGETCTLAFRPCGSWLGNGPREVSGTVTDAGGAPLYTIEGHWDQRMQVRNASSGADVATWVKPDAEPDPHGLPGSLRAQAALVDAFDAQPQDKALAAAALLPSDSRLRPDRRALAAGLHAEAQRHRLRLAHLDGTLGKDAGQRPRWFAQDAQGNWIFRGGYFEERQRRLDALRERRDTSPLALSPFKPSDRWP